MGPDDYDVVGKDAECWAGGEDRKWPCRQAVDVVYSHSTGWGRAVLGYEPTREAAMEAFAKAWQGA